MKKWAPLALRIKWMPQQLDKLKKNGSLLLYVFAGDFAAATSM